MSNVEAIISSEADTSAIKNITSARIRIFCKKASFRKDVIPVTNIPNSATLTDLDYPNTFLHLTLHNVSKLWYLYHMSHVDASNSLEADWSAIKKITSARIRTFFKKAYFRKNCH